ncbi:hypothetical protein ACMYR2_2115 [Nitrobacter sp. TKz-YC01]
MIIQVLRPGNNIVTGQQQAVADVYGYMFSARP